MALCVVNGTRLVRAAWWPRATVLIVIVIIVAVTAAEGWTLPDVTALIVAVTAAAGARLSAAREQP